MATPVTVRPQNLAQADLTAAAASSGQVLTLEDNVYTVSANTTLPSTCKIVAGFGSVLYINSGVTLTVNCEVSAPEGQVLFKGAGTVAGTFGTKTVSATWFGSTSGTPPYGQAPADSTKTGYPVVDAIDAPVAEAGADAVITGRDLIGEMAFDALAMTLGDSAGVLTFTASKPGVSGLSVEVLASDTGTSLTTAFASDVITIQLAEAGNTAAEVVTAFNGDADVDGICRVTATGSGTTTSAVAETVLAGGVGDYANTKVVVAGTAAPPANEAAGAATWADTEITVTVDGTPLTATEVATLQVQVDGVWSNTLSFVVAA